MFGGVYGDARMPNWLHRHRTPFPGIATMGLRRDNLEEIIFVVNVNTFFKWVPNSQSRVTYDLDTDLDTQHRHHNPQNYWSSGEPPLPCYACIYHRYI